MPGAAAGLTKLGKTGGAGVLLLTVIYFAPRIVQWANGPDEYVYNDSWLPVPGLVKDNVGVTLTITRIGIHKARLWADEYRDPPQPVPKSPKVTFTFGEARKADFAVPPPATLNPAGQATLTIYGTGDADATSLHASVETSRGALGIQTYETVNDPSFPTQEK